MTTIEMPSARHYYGDVVRLLFLFCAVVMVVGLPAVSNLLGIPTAFSVLGVLALSLAAGLTNPKLLWVAGLNVAVAIIGFVVFESYAVSLYRTYGIYNKFFITNLLLGFVFLFAIYFSVKTLRGLLLNKNV